MNNAFYEYTNLKNVNIPQSVTVIEESAFYGCSSLTTIEIPEGVTDIQRKAFEKCNAASSISLPKTLRYIGSSAFSSTKFENATINCEGIWRGTTLTTGGFDCCKKESDGSYTKISSSSSGIEAYYVYIDDMNQFENMFLEIKPFVQHSSTVTDYPDNNHYIQHGSKANERIRID